MRKYKCPHCGSIRSKVKALDEMSNAGTALMYTNHVEPCPACGSPIRIGDIVAGKYDYKESIAVRLLKGVGCLVVVVIVIWIIGLSSQ